MTDNEIIKEFDLFLKYSAPEQLLNDVLDLINRQKAEIERLNNTIKIQDLDICNLTKQSMICDAGFLQELESTKTEAIKEFAERLKKCYETYPDDEEASALYLINKINDLVKEMVGDNDESKI